MKDIKQRIEKLRLDAEECSIISKRSTSAAKRKAFLSLSDEYHRLAQELERLLESGDLPG